MIIIILHTLYMIISKTDTTLGAIVNYLYKLEGDNKL